MYSNYKDNLIKNWNISIFLVGLVLDVSVYGSSSVFCLLTSNMTNDVWVDDADGVFWRRTKNVRIIGLWLTHFAHLISFWPKGMQYRFITAFKYKNSHALLSTHCWNRIFHLMGIFFVVVILCLASGYRIQHIFFFNFIIRLSLGLMEACFTLGSCPYQRHSNYHR